MTATVSAGGPVPPLDPDRLVGIVGAGAMGLGIAEVAARAGHDVLVYDVDRQRLGRELSDVATALFRRALEEGLTEEAASARVRQLRGAQSLAELAPARIVIEAVVESLAIKRELFAALEEIVAPTAVLATNTSSLSVTAIQDGLNHPERVVGMHFFNPAQLLPLVEVVSGAHTDAAVADRVFQLSVAWGKTPVHAASTPGFIVNRVARPFYGEAFAAYEEGVADPATIDAVMREAGGFRMGPFQLSDLIGHDINAAVSRSVWEQLGSDPRFTPSPSQRELLAAGRLGRKSGHGWYDYADTVDRPLPSTWPQVAAAAESSAQPRPRRAATAGSSAQAGPRTAATAGSPAKPPLEGGEVRLASGGLLLRTDGRTAAAVSDQRGVPVVLLDAVGDPAAAIRVAVALSPGLPDAVRDEAIALLQGSGLAASVVGDGPGLLVARTVSMLVNVAADAVEAGVAEPAAVDLAMVKGVNYPRGPLAWGDHLGPAWVVTVLDQLARTDPSGRYRVSPWLRTRAERGEPLR